MKVLNKELLKTIYNEIKINSKITQSKLAKKYIVNGKDKRWYILK